MNIISKKLVIAAVLVVTILVLIIIICSILIYKWGTESSLGLLIFREHVSSEKLVKNLSSTKSDLVQSSLWHLANRRDPAGKEPAQKLLLSKDDYIWFDACLYLAAIDDKQAIPYLIKGLKHQASGAHDEVAGYLEQLTDENFGKDQGKWIAWWKQNNPDSEFNFEYKNPNQKSATALSSRHLLINGVEDPLTISHLGNKIKLMGLKLKENADQEKALILLKTAALFQVIQVEMENVTLLDDERPLRALVYWIREGPKELYLIGRKDLPPVPFRNKTLIQEYLIQSGLYELNLDDVIDPEIKNVLNSIKG